MSKNHDHYPVTRDDLLFTLETALRKAAYLWPQRHDSGDPVPVRLEFTATAVLEHLDLCGIRCVRTAPAPLQGALGAWPPSRQGGGADRGGAEAR